MPPATDFIVGAAADFHAPLQIWLMGGEVPAAFGKLPAEWLNAGGSQGRETMIDGGHVILYSRDAEADKAFIRDVLKFKHVDAGHGWLIFKLPPSEIAVHPSDENDMHEFYLMTDDLDAEIAALKQAGAACEEISQQRWGKLTRIKLPGGGTL